MRSTMPSYPLTVGSVVRHAVAVHGDRQTTTPVAPGEVRRVSYAELGERAGPDAAGGARAGDHRR